MMEVRPSRIALQGEVLNHRALLRLRRVVVSSCGKGTGKVSGENREDDEQEPLSTSRKRRDGIKTGVQLLPRDESGGYLLTGQAVPG